MSSRALAGFQGWGARQWLTATAAAVAFALVVAIPTDLVDTPVFGREIPPTWWAWPALGVTAVLTGLLVGTYVAPGPPDDAVVRRGGWLGGALTFFAVGCPVCNKLVLLLLGTSGALAWFEPVQPLLQVAALALVAWALRTRLLGAVACRASEAPPAAEALSRPRPTPGHRSDA